MASLGVSDEWIDKLATVKSPIAFSLMPKPPHPTHAAWVQDYLTSYNFTKLSKYDYIILKNAINSYLTTKAVCCSVPSFAFRIS